MAIIWGENETQFFYHLDPNVVLNSIESLGLKTTGRCLALNSMENRVYEIELDNDADSPADRFVVVKFYRPGRWSRKQILDEHQFLLELLEEDLPVVAPKEFDGETLFQVEGHELYFTVFPKRGGRIPEEMDDEQLEIVGRLLARLHNVGATREAKHRLHINPETFGRKNMEYLLESGAITPSHREGFRTVVEQLCGAMDPLFDKVPIHRIHGDCHKGNILYRDGIGPNLVDFDDMLMGPAVQDIWLVVPGQDEHAMKDRNTLLDAYDSMRSFDYRTLNLIEPLRALRYIHFAAWMAKRWDDQAFKEAFPYFGTDQYWSTLITDLHEQLQKIQTGASSATELY